MLDENIFLTFDSKFKEIGKEKEKFKEDIDKYKQFSDNINLIQNVIEKTYNEIYNFLIKYLAVTEFENLKNQINSQNINVIDKKRILNTLLSDVKKRPNSEKKNLRIKEKINPNKANIHPGDHKKHNLINKNINFQNHDNDNINMNLFPNKVNKEKNDMEIENDQDTDNNRIRANSRYNLRSTKPKGAENYIHIEEDDNDNDNVNKNANMKNVESGYSFNNMEPNVFDDKNYNADNYQETHNNNLNNKYSNYNKDIEDTNPINKNNYISNERNMNINTSQNNNIDMNRAYEEEEEEEELSNSPIYNIICNIVPSKNQIVLYNVDKDCIIRKTINFSPLLGLNHFLQDCAWVNNNNKLYILGGTSDESSATKIFIVYDPIKDKMRRLPDSLYPHSKHSLFVYKDQIYAIGGDNLQCERYDINKNEWSTLPNLSFIQIYPVLYVHDDTLYSFFGIDENIKKSDNIQKLHLNNKKAKWQKVNYKRNKCNLNVYGCGIAKINENCILFLGGMDDNGIRDDAIQFDFSNLTAKKTDFLLEEKAYFKDSILLKLSKKDFGNFSIEESNPFLKIKFQVNVKKLTH